MVHHIANPPHALRKPTRWLRPDSMNLPVTGQQCAWFNLVFFAAAPSLAAQATF